MMKKIFKLAALFAISSLVGLTGCTEELSTDQFSDDTVVLSAFAPNPVVRGAELRIMGSNLDKIVEVQIPGAEPITEIEVISTGRVSEIRVVTPAAGAEDASVTGPVVLIDKSGNTYKSKTELSFTEGIVLDSFSPATAMPGDEITVKGDYLYNVQQVVLNNGVYVTGDQITAKSRRELKFIVPSNAVTGPVTIGDVDENNNPDGLIPNNVPSKTELVIGEPSVKTADRGMLKAGAEITIQGSYLDMIQEAAFRVGETDTQVDFALAEDNKSIKVVLPASVVEGEIVLTSYAGKEFKAGAYTTVVPTNVAIAAESRFKAGLKAVVTGKDLDLVTGATLAGTALQYVYADNKLTFNIPGEAVDGTVVLSLANGKTVETAAIELVKPVITSVSPLELYAGDESVVVAGEDLDLVVSATLGGRDEEIEAAADGKSVKVATTVSSVSGKVVLSLENGVVIESTDEVKVNYHSLVIVTEKPAMQHIGEEVVLKGSNFSLVENIFIGDVKVTQYSLRTDEEVRFLMPWNKVGMYSLSFHLFSGDVETLATQIEVGLERVFTTLWEGESAVTWSAGAVTNLSWGGYDWSKVKAGATLMATVSTAGTGSVRFGNGSWAGLPSFKQLPGYNSYDNVDITSDVTYVAITLTNDDLAELVNNGGFVLCGDGYTAHKIELITEISQEKTLWEGEVISAEWAGQGLLTDAGVELKEAGATAGQIVYFYIEPLVEGWQLKIVEGHWGPTYLAVCASAEYSGNGEFTPYDLAGNGGKVPLTLTQEMLDTALTQQWWGNTFLIQGNNVKCTKITLL